MWQGILFATLRQHGNDIVRSRLHCWHIVLHSFNLLRRWGNIPLCTSLCYLQISWKGIWSYHHGSLNQEALPGNVIAQKKKILNFLCVCVRVSQPCVHSSLLQSSGAHSPSQHRGLPVRDWCCELASSSPCIWDSESAWISRSWLKLK